MARPCSTCGEESCFGAGALRRVALGLAVLAIGAVVLGALWPTARSELAVSAGLKGKDPRVVRDGADARQSPRSRWLLLPPPPKPRRVTPPCEDPDAYRSGPW